MSDLSGIRLIAAPRALLWVELAAFFVGVPLAMALVMPPELMFAVLLPVTVIGLVLLHITDGFHWSELLRGWGRVEWRVVAVFAAVTAVIAAAVALHAVPDYVLFLPREHPFLLVMILLGYPFLSALPQEIVFRPLFFRRYGRLIPDRGVAYGLNATLFALAHLMYWNWIVAALTFAGGLIFSWAYEARGSFALAVVLHSVAGGVLFISGAGVLFYSGMIVRPF